jgi:hypothetical protein
MARYVTFALVPTQLDIFDSNVDTLIPLMRLMPPVGTVNREYFIQAAIQLALASSPRARMTLITISDEMEKELGISKIVDRIKSRMKNARIGDVRILHPLKVEREKTPSGQVKTKYFFQVPVEHPEVTQKLSPEKLEF